MRPFRGKRIDNGEWVCGWYCQNRDKHYIVKENTSPLAVLLGENVFTLKGYSFVFIEVIPETAGQFVCKDKNGKDVFAGDKIKWLSQSVSNHFCEDIVKANYMRGAWVTSPAGVDIALCHILADIELLEEKQNDC